MTIPAARKASGQINKNRKEKLIVRILKGKLRSYPLAETNFKRRIIGAHACVYMHACVCCDYQSIHIDKGDRTAFTQLKKK